MKKVENLPYLETPVKETLTTEQLIFGNGETITERDRRRKIYQQQQINEQI